MARQRMRCFGNGPPHRFAASIVYNIRRSDARSRLRVLDLFDDGAGQRIRNTKDFQIDFSSHTRISASRIGILACKRHCPFVRETGSGYVNLNIASSAQMAPAR
jgi:hypothetical protein